MTGIVVVAAVGNITENIMNMKESMVDVADRDVHRVTGSLMVRGNV